MTIAATALPLAAVLALALAGCDGTTPAEVAEAAPETTPQTTPEGDLLAPDVYSFAGQALWDGRPSLGGVWIAHPEVEEPARAWIRRSDGAGTPVTGALFRRERIDEGPPMQVSSEAAAALDLAAGEPVALEVTALRRPPEAAPDATEDAPRDHEQDP